MASDTRSCQASTSKAMISSTKRTRTTRRASSRVDSIAMLVAGALAALVMLAVPVQAAQFEPPGNQVLFGVWLDVSSGYSDTPKWVNQRVQHNIPVFQLAQSIPLPAYNYTTGAGGAAPESSIEVSGTDAAVFLTVYPTDGFGAVTDADFEGLAQQISVYQTTYNRTVFLRYAPEMQGLWFPYGNKPAQFNQSWHQMAGIVKSIAPETILVWAPNTPQGYPYGQTIDQDNNAADQAALDTNGDGTLSSADNPFSPYYPGDDVVDWIGLSIYYKGPGSDDTTNQAQTAGYCANVINGYDPARNQAMANWYQTYCAAKPSKACMFAESGAAFHVNDGGVSTQLEIQTAWMQDCIVNASLYDAFPRLRMVMSFEFEKYETANDGSNDLRDFRMTNSSQVLQEFVAEIESGEMATRFSWANPRATPTYISSPGQAPYTPSVYSTTFQAITSTTRARPTGFPALFGNTFSGASQLIEFVELGVLVACGLAGVFTVMRNL